MQRIFCLSALVFLLSGALSSCGGSGPARITDTFMEILGEPASEQTIEKANAYLKANLASLNREQAGELLLLWEEYALNYDNASVDYSRLIDEYAAEIPDYMTALFEYKDLEQRRPIIFDATLRVDWRELASRTLALEDYIGTQRENEAVRDEALWLYKRYVNALLMGASNSPVFDYGTHEFSRELLAQYDVILSERPDAALAAVLKEYETYLAGLGYVLEYDQKEESAKFFETCSRLVSEAERRASGAEETH